LIFMWVNVVPGKEHDRISGREAIFRHAKDAVLIDFRCACSLDVLAFNQRQPKGGKIRSAKHHRDAAS
jgi:hypothetical protein